VQCVFLITVFTNDPDCIHQIPGMKNILTILLLFAVIATACNNKQKYEIKSTDKYEKTKASLEEVEKKEPSRFLAVSGYNKRNLVGQTVVRGTVYNNAKLVNFKDIDIKLSFYSKTGALLEEDHHVVYETIHPGGSAGFKSKYFAPKGTDSVAMKVITAKF
jgi:hypothetical protein